MKDFENSILNDSMNLAMEWGDDWLRPIQKRFRKKYPKLSESECDEYNSVAQQSMNYGHELVYKMVEKNGAEVNQDDFEKRLSEKYPWVKGKNIKRCYSQGRYYAWKNMGC